jgi:hypothetical protein
MRRGIEREKEKKLDVLFCISSFFFRWGKKGNREITSSVFVDGVLKSTADCRELEWSIDEYEE